MIHRLRTVLTLLLLAALPLQGYAAAGMLYCGESANSVAVAEHRLEYAMFHDKPAHHVHAAAADAELIDPDRHEYGQCSVCSSCCNAAALPAHGVSSKAFALQLAPLLESQHTAPRRIPARLERPPRFLLV
jgi:hypothetical protein